MYVFYDSRFSCGARGQKKTMKNEKTWSKWRFLQVGA